MKIVNIFEKKEYFMLFKFFVFNIFTFLFYSDYVKNNLLIYYKISLTVFSLYNIYCIFIESTFDNKYLQVLQIKLQNKNSFFISFIGLISVISTFFLYFIFPNSFIVYKIKCPFLLKNFDYKIHAQKRCELYNINSINIFPYQYICSYNAEKIPFIFVHFFYFLYPQCSKIEKIINNNIVIEAFIKEYYKEQNLYFCDLDRKPLGLEVDPKLCDAKIIIYPEILYVLNFYFCIRCIIYIYTYFRIIEPNINHYEHLHLL